MTDALPATPPPPINPADETGTVRLGLPKGRMQKAVNELLSEAGIHVREDPRGYRPDLSLPGFEVKLLKPQNIVRMLHHGSRDLGFAGADWVVESGANLVELLDTGLDPVRLVAAAPPDRLHDGRLMAPDDQGDNLIIASEYESVTRQWIERCELPAEFVRSYGATEVFPPEDADCIVDNTATGATLRENGLVIFDELMRSSTRLYANPQVLEDGPRREAIDRFVVLVRSVLEARQRVMLEVNVGADQLESLINALPSMREPTVSPLHGESGYAVKSAVPRARLPQVIPALKACGGTDIIVSPVGQIVP